MDKFFFKVKIRQSLNKLRTTAAKVETELAYSRLSAAAFTDSKPVALGQQNEEGNEFFSSVRQ